MNLPSNNEFARAGQAAQTAVDRALEHFRTKAAAAGQEAAAAAAAARPGHASGNSEIEIVPTPIKQLLEWYSVGRLYLCANGRFALNGHEFHCGECFEIFRPIYGTATGRWHEVRIEHSSCFYLVGDARQGDDLIGIIARRKHG